MTGFFGKTFAGTAVAFALAAGLGVGAYTLASEGGIRTAQAMETANQREVYVVFFAPGDAALDPIAQEVVALAADLSTGAKRVTVIGRVNVSGDEAALNGLADERAAVVAGALADLGVAAEIVDVAVPETVALSGPGGDEDLQRAEIVLEFGKTETAEVVR